ncbi:uncharacterized protein LOC135310682 [Phalacrocorax carbo]|uniref:uncharacterized protein LOC135310682 n=1 Tax=Phalacrocorax carbo TaxID=9209 RepID=UPI003119EA39
MDKELVERPPPKSYSQRLKAHMDISKEWSCPAARRRRGEAVGERWSRRLGKWEQEEEEAASEEQRGSVAGAGPPPQLVQRRGARMIKYLLFSPLGPEKLPTLKELTTSGRARFLEAGSGQEWSWAAPVLRVFAQGEAGLQFTPLSPPWAVHIGVGTFAVVPAQATVGEDKVLPVERPVFRPCRFLKKFYKLRCAKTKIPDETLSVPLDFEQIAADIHFRREIVEQCIHETLLFFAGALRDNKEVEFSFKGIGILAVRRKAVSMTFFDDCLLELDATGNMLAALLEDSKMRGIVAFPGKNDFTRLSRDGVITLPR